ncbi:MAG: glycosyltransferase family 2 protein [Acidimicrobiales bacterium]
MPAGERLTLFFPMWNEEEIIGRTVDAARETGDDLSERGDIAGYEILIVDDASTDGTAKLADELAAADDRIRVVHHAENRGLGGSVRTGLAEARGDLILYTDADMPADLADLAKALRLLRIYDADIVTAYRHDRTGEGAKRAVYSYIYNTLVKALLRLRIRDVNFAFKLVRRRVLDDVKLHSEGSFVDVELLAKAQRMGFAIIQFGVDYFPRARGASSLSSPSVIIRIVREFAALYPDILRTKPPPRRRRG